jgi:hypothetical protein
MHTSARAKRYNARVKESKTAKTEQRRGGTGALGTRYTDKTEAEGLSSTQNPLDPQKSCPSGCINQPFFRTKTCTNVRLSTKGTKESGLSRFGFMTPRIGARNPRRSSRLVCFFHVRSVPGFLVPTPFSALYVQRTPWRDAVAALICPRMAASRPAQART